MTLIEWPSRMEDSLKPLNRIEIDIEVLEQSGVSLQERNDAHLSEDDVSPRVLSFKIFGKDKKRWENKLLEVERAFSEKLP